jgi:transcriptional regulator with XRE-family HTH domain
MKERRRTLGLSQAKLAEKVNSAPTYIAMIELEKKFPSVDMLERIAAALEFDSPELFSMKSYPAELLNKLHEAVLTDFGNLIINRLDKFEQNNQKID